MKPSTNWKRGIAPMDKYQIVITPKARDDLIDIGDYISFILLEPETAEKFIRGLRRSISQLQYFPKKLSASCRT